MTNDLEMSLSRDSKTMSAQVENQAPEDLKDVTVRGDYSGAVAKSSPEEIALVRKLDLRLLPTLWCMYFMNYLDRSAIANARLNGLEDDVHLAGSQYETCISILFVGYLLGQVPSNMIMSSSKVRPSLYLSFWMIAWAAVSACTAAVRNYEGLVTVRFFLGLAEAPFYPGALYLLSQFYTRKELATRISVLWSGNIFATAFAGLIAAATFSTVDGAQGIAGWQWLFIIEGVVTFAVAVAGAFLLPDTPLTTRWLTPEQRELAQARMDRDTVGIEANKGVRAGFMQSIRDPRLYLFVFMQNMHVSSQSFSNFFPSVVHSMGFGEILSLVLTCPPYLVSGFIVWGVGLSSGKFNERTFHIIVPMLVALVGFIISCTTLNTGARYFATFLFACGTYSVNAIIIGWVSATLGQTTEKKGISLSIVNVIANLSNVYTPYLYPESDEPGYVTGMAANAAFATCCALSAWAMRIWLKKTNKSLGPQNGLYYAY